MASTATCKYGAKEKTVEQVITSCAIYYHLNGARALLDVNKNLVTWQKEIFPAIYWTFQLPSISAKQKRKRLVFKNKNQEIRDRFKVKTFLYFVKIF